MHELNHTVWGHFMAMWRQPSASRMGPYDQSLFLAVVRLATLRNVVNRNGDCSRLSRWSFRQRRIQSNAWGPDTRCSESSLMFSECSLMFSLCSVNLSDGSRIRYRNQSKSTESTESLYPAVQGMSSTSHERSCSRWRTWNLRSNPLFENPCQEPPRAWRHFKTGACCTACCIVLRHTSLSCPSAWNAVCDWTLQAGAEFVAYIQYSLHKFNMFVTCSLHVWTDGEAVSNVSFFIAVLEMNWSDILALNTRSARFTWPLCDGWPSFSEWRAEMHRVDSQLLNTNTSQMPDMLKEQGYSDAFRMYCIWFIKIFKID